MTPRATRAWATSGTRQSSRTCTERQALSIGDALLLHEGERGGRGDCGARFAEDEAIRAHHVLRVPLENWPQIQPMAGHCAAAAGVFQQRPHQIQSVFERRVVDRVAIEEVDDVLDAVFFEAL